jgi:peptide/nickel transport system permease protein
MTRYVMIRLLQGVVALLIATIIVFWLARLTGNPANLFLPSTASIEDYNKITQDLGLDKPLLVQYWAFISHAARGDFGQSYFTPRNVTEMIVERLPATLKLAALAILVSIIVAIPMGVIAAVKRNKWQDTLAKMFAMFGQSAPGFWLSIMLILIFGVKLRWLPAGGYGGIQYYILPAVALSVFPMSGFLRIIRSAMLDTLGTDYVRLARIKGLPERTVIWKHSLRNALIPVVTFGGVFYTLMLTGSVIVETIFAWPGIGRLAYESVIHRDFPVMQGIVVVFVALFIISNLAIDILYAYLDPRVRYVKV